MLCIPRCSSRHIDSGVESCQSARPPRSTTAEYVYVHVCVTRLWKRPQRITSAAAMSSMLVCADLPCCKHDSLAPAKINHRPSTSCLQQSEVISRVAQLPAQHGCFGSAGFHPCILSTVRLSNLRHAGELQCSDAHMGAAVQSSASPSSPGTVSWHCWWRPWRGGGPSSLCRCRVASLSILILPSQRSRAGFR